VSEASEGAGVRMADVSGQPNRGRHRDTSEVAAWMPKQRSCPGTRPLGGADDRITDHRYDQSPRSNEQFRQDLGYWCAVALFVPALVAPQARGTRGSSLPVRRIRRRRGRLP
jgi:hypothetical protein